MIIKSNNNVYKNYFGEDNVSKVYAGENLVFGKEDPNKTSKVQLWFINIVDGNKLQNGAVTLQSDKSIRSGGAMAVDFEYGSENTISISENNISKIEVLMYWEGDDYSPYSGNTVISTGQLIHNQEDHYSLWTINGSTGTIQFNNTYRDPQTKQYITRIQHFEVTYYYTV